MKKSFDKNYYMNIADNIREEIKQKGYKQGYIARYVDLTAANFSNKMNGNSMFTIWEIEAIACKLQCTIEHLLRREK